MNTFPSRRKLGAVLGLAICLLGPSARAITLDFSIHGVGWYAPASEANNETDATKAVDDLIKWYNGGLDPNGGTITFNLSPGSNVPLPNLPRPVTFGFKDETVPFSTINSATYDYVRGKYGNVAYIFYIGNLAPGEHTLPNVVDHNELSHLLAFSGPRRSVPDGGATMALLGLSLLCVEALRRKFQRA